MRKSLKTAVFLLFCVAVLSAGCGKKAYRDGLDSLRDGHYEEAASQFAEAAEAERNVGDSWLGIGISRWETGDYEGASQAFEEALQNGAEATGTIYNFLGACQMKLENPSAAIEYYEQGIAKGDCREEVLREMKFNVIVACEQLKEWETAKEKLKAYTEEYPDDEAAAKEAEFLETR